MGTDEGWKDRVVVVDDEELFCKIMERRLHAFGYDTGYALSALDGLRLGEKIRPGVFIVDWMMPEMDGIELVQKIRANKDLSDAYIIMMTAKSGLAERDQALKAGADEFLTKPVNTDILKSHLKAGTRIAGLNHELRRMGGHTCE